MCRPVLAVLYMMHSFHYDNLNYVLVICLLFTAIATVLHTLLRKTGEGKSLTSQLEVKLPDL